MTDPMQQAVEVMARAVWNTRTPAPDVSGLVEALRSTLNFIQNTESEVGVILGCGDRARAELAKWEGR